MARKLAQVAILPALAVALALAGCEAPARDKPWRRPRPSPSPTAEPAASVALARERAERAARRDHALRIRLEADPTHLNPLIDPDRETLWVAEDTIFETLVRYEGAGGEGPGRYVPGLAESWRPSPDGREIRIFVREGVKFHDGRGFGVVDAQFSIDAARSAHVRSPRLREALGAIALCEIISTREVRLVLRRPDAYVLRALAELPMLPYHVYGEGDLNRHPRNKQPIGTGPYRFVRWDKHERIVLARHAGYWGQAPAIEEIEFVIEPDAARAIAEAKRGELDVLPSLVAAHYPEQAALMAADFAELRLRPLRLQYLVLNAARPPFDDVRVRRAVALLVDRKRLAEEVLSGFAVPIAGPVWPGGPGDGATPGPPAFDPAAAARLLDEAGWVDGDGDGARERGGERLRIELLVPTDGRGDAGRELVVTALEKAGFQIERKPGEPAVLTNRLRDRAFDAAFVDWRGRRDDDLGPLFSAKGSRNWGGFASKEVDAVLAAMEVAWEPAARAPRAAELAALLAEHWPIVALTAEHPVGLVHRRVRGLVVRDGWFAIRDLSLEPGR